MTFLIIIELLLIYLFARAIYIGSDADKYWYVGENYHRAKRLYKTATVLGVLIIINFFFILHAAH